MRPIGRVHNNTRPTSRHVIGSDASGGSSADCNLGLIRCRHLTRSATRRTAAYTCWHWTQTSSLCFVCCGQVTSQVPYFEDFIGPPHTHTVDYDDDDALRAVLDNITNSTVLTVSTISLLHPLSSVFSRFLSLSLPTDARTMCACMFL